jgi:hypothetical protein
MHCRSRAQKKSIRLIASACSPNRTEAALHRSPPQSAMLAHRFLLLVAVAAAAASGIASAKPTAYEALADYDFPPRILPKGVVAYKVDNATGAFTATLDASASGAGSSICEFSIEGSLATLPDQDHRQDLPRPPHRPPGCLRQGPLLLAQHRRGHPPWR